MLCYCIADFFFCIHPVILSDYREKAAVSQFIIVLLAIDKGKSAPIVFHNGFGIIAGFDHIQDKLLFRIVSVKEAIHAHGLRAKHNGNVVVIGYFF